MEAFNYDGYDIDKMFYPEKIYLIYFSIREIENYKHHLSEDIDQNSEIWNNFKSAYNKYYINYYNGYIFLIFYSLIVSTSNTCGLRFFSCSKKLKGKPEFKFQKERVCCNIL